MSALAGTIISENARGIVFKVTGDGVATQITLTSKQYLSREQSGQTASPNQPDSATAVVNAAPTTYGYPSGTVKGYDATGMLCPIGGTAATVSSVSIAAGTMTSTDPSTVVTITLGAAMTNATVYQGWVAWNQDRPRI